jgi:tRNA(fMet)-specific endonuclease VapC
LLDTNIVSFHIRRSSAVLQRRLRRTRSAAVGLSVVTEMELRYGMARTPELKIAPLVEEFLRGITILPLTSEVAGHYEVIRATLDRKGTPIGPLDLMIASHALSIDAVLVTSNVGEFRRVPGLKFQDWTK